MSHRKTVANQMPKDKKRFHALRAHETQIRWDGRGFLENLEKKD